tara:strand:- start:1713 stop:2345 length:633 start_codon:yes stop_codon:yes gene_type:complete
VKAIIFDFDGVILDSVNVKTNAFSEMYSKWGNKTQNAVIKHHLENGGVSRFEKFKIYHKKFLNINLSKNEISELADDFSKLVFDGVCNSPFIPGAEEFLKIVKNNYSTFICTGTPQKEIEEILITKKLNKFFNSVHGSPDDKITIINFIMRTNSFEPKDVLFIGDAMTDYNASIATNINFIGVKNLVTTFPKGTIEVENLLEIIKIKNLF